MMQEALSLSLMKVITALRSEKRMAEVETLEKVLDRLGYYQLREASPSSDLAEALEDVLRVADKEFWRDKAGLRITAHPVLERARAALSARREGMPDGWKLVPVEPTEAMLEALEGTMLSDLGPDAEKAYRAMLAAAPLPSPPDAADARFVE